MAAEAPQLDPHVAAIMRVADQTRAKGDLLSAAGLYRRAHQLAPNRTEPLMRLGGLFNDTGKSDNAMSAYRRVLHLTPSDTEAMRGLGLALLHKGEVDKALVQFQAALELQEDTRLYNALGVAHDMLEDHEIAQIYYRKGLILDPSYLSLSTNLGLSLALSGAYAESIDLLNGVARNPAASVKHRQVLALAYGLAGDVAAAARTNRIDLDETMVRENLRYYESLRAQSSSSAPSNDGT